MQAINYFDLDAVLEESGEAPPKDILGMIEDSSDDDDGGGGNDGDDEE